MTGKTAVGDPVFCLVYDAEFKESDHPRDKGGKFTEGGGATGGAAPESPVAKSDAYYAAGIIGQVLNKAGYKKMKGAKLPTYKHPSGAMLVIHPEPGKTFSSAWTSEKTGKQIVAGTGAPKLQALLQDAINRAEAEKKPTAPNQGSVIDFAKKHGYNAYGVEGDMVTAVKGEAVIEVNFSTGDWLAKTPGHITKIGNGLENLDTLLSRKPFKGSDPPWVNVSNMKTMKGGQAPSQTLEEHQAMKAAAEKAKAESDSDAAQQAQNKTKALLMHAAPEPTQIQLDAIRYYTGSGYESMNADLRHNPHAVISHHMKRLDEYLKGATLPNDVQLYRRVSGEYAKILRSIVAVGAKFLDRGYVSSSTHSGAWHGELTMKINAKKGQRGASVVKHSAHPDENEVLLPRGSFFVVKSYDPAKGEMEVDLDQSHMNPESST